MLLLPDYLKPLETVTSPFPEDAVEEAIARREETTPILLAALEWTAENAADTPPNFLFHEFALRILAQFRDTRAFPAAILLARHPLADDLLGDTLSDGLGKMLASVSGGDPGPLKTLVEDTAADGFARAAGLQAMGVLVRGGLISREELSVYLGELFAGGLKKDDSFIWTALADMCANFGFAEHLEAVRATFDEGLVDPMWDTWKNMEQRISSGTFDEKVTNDFLFFEDAIESMAWWHCFDAPDPGDFDGEETDEDGWERREPRLAFDEEEPEERAPKIGRNDPCPCGSGKKYKKCCGR